MYGHFYDVQNHLKKWTKSDSFAAHCRQQIKSNTSHTDLCNYMILKLVKHLNNI